MALFTQQDLISRVRNDLRKGGISKETVSQKAHRLLNESISEQRTYSATSKTYDIFLSHSFNDATLIAGLKLELEDLGYSVYIDWIDDPKLKRDQVTRDTAKLLQTRLESCRSLFYAFTPQAAESKWMPWELGYFDGLKHKAAVLPISHLEQDDFKGTEFVGIYNYIAREKAKNSERDYLWVHESKDIYVRYDYWLTNNKQPYKH